MKKSLIALAVLAASGAAMAQSSVTLYGIADVHFGSIKTETAAAVGTANTSLRQTALTSGGVNTSRWGMKGSEDLGGGLKANFDFQQGFTLDDGASSSLTTADGVAAKGVKSYPFAFQRQAWVGMSGGFGAVRLGRTTTPFDDVSGASNSLFDSQLSPVNSGGGLSVFKSTGYQSRPNNILYYQAPSFSGFSGALSYSLGENKTAAASAGKVISLNVTYAGGPFAAQMGYQSEKDTGNAVAVKFTRLGASYDLGMAKLKATYGKAQNFRSSISATTTEGAIVGNPNAGFEATDWHVGVDVPMSAALTLSAGYAKSSDNAAAGDADRDGYGIAAAYTLSKRTMIYGGYGSSTTSKAGFNDSSNSVLAIGVNHKF